MKGILFSIAAGLCITLQGIFNTNMAQELGGWHTTSLVHLVGFTLSLTVFLFVRDGSRQGLKGVRPLYFIGGSFGVIVVFAELTSILLLGPAAAISILLVAQLLGAFTIESLGWFEQKKITIHKHQVVGIAMMVIGVILLKW
ncbi:DMT family transporter [Halobacillus fulvus]|nr:DMT family transporter [Halobacillus fulvus]